MSATIIKKPAYLLGFRIRILHRPSAISSIMPQLSPSGLDSRAKAKHMRTTVSTDLLKALR